MASIILPRDRAVPPGGLLVPSRELTFGQHLLSDPRYRFGSGPLIRPGGERLNTSNYRKIPSILTNAPLTIFAVYRMNKVKTSTRNILSTNDTGSTWAFGMQSRLASVGVETYPGSFQQISLPIYPYTYDDAPITMCLAAALGSGGGPSGSSSRHIAYTAIEANFTATSALATGATHPTRVGADMWVGCKGSFGSPADGADLDVLAWGLIPAALNINELTELTCNPWQMFRSERRVLYFDVGGGGGATLVTANDTLTPSLTEVQASLISSSVTEGLTITLTESQSSRVSSNVTDSLLPSLSEVSALLKNPEFVTVTDTLSVSVTEALALLATSIITDTLAPGLTESAFLNTTGAFEVAVTDGLTPSLAEVQTSLTSSALVEALALSLGEVQGSLLTSSITDTLAPGVTEATATLAQLLVSTGLTPALTEAQTSLVYSGVSEALELVLGEVQGSLVFSTVTEAFSISVSESVALLVAHTTTDTLIVSLTDTSGLVSAAVIAKEVSEALAPYFTELGTLELLDAWQHASQVVGVWASGTAGSGAWNAETPISGTWTEDPPL